MEEEVLVPIRVDLTLDLQRYCDFFLWNLYEKRITPEHFARQTCIDLDLPVIFEAHISRTIRSQLTNFTSISNSNPTTNNEELQQQQQRTITIQMDITIGGVTLKDQVEWNIHQNSLIKSMMNPFIEIFARKTVNELGLPKEFLQAISFTIREQILRYFSQQTTSQLQQQNHTNGMRATEEILAFGPVVIPPTAIDRKQIGSAIVTIPIK